MSTRLIRNLYAVTLVAFILYLLLLLAGCSLIKLERTAGDYHEKVTVLAPPKDWKALSYHWYELDLRAGDAATSAQPWADVVGDLGPLLLNMQAYCKAYPVMCVPQ